MFQLLNTTNNGKRGRPSKPRKYKALHNEVLSVKGTKLGEVTMEASADGGVLLVAVINGKRKKIEFPAVKPTKRSK